MPPLTAFLATALVLRYGQSGFKAALAVLLIACAWAAFAYPPAGLCALIAASAVDGILKGVRAGWLTLLFKDIVLWMCLMRWLYDWASGRPREAVRTRIFAIMVVFAIWVIAELANETTISILVGLAGVRTWICLLYTSPSPRDRG